MAKIPRKTRLPMDEQSAIPPQPQSIRKPPGGEINVVEDEKSQKRREEYLKQIENMDANEKIPIPQPQEEMDFDQAPPQSVESQPKSVEQPQVQVKQPKQSVDPSLVEAIAKQLSSQQQAATPKKVNFMIQTDGSKSGTQIVVNGQEITNRFEELTITYKKDSNKVMIEGLQRFSI